MADFSSVKINTSTALTGSASYTSSAVSGMHYGWLIGTCLADKAGTLSCQQTNDTTNWDGAHEDVSYTASDTMLFSFEVAAEWVRLKFTNGADAQGTFRLQARFKKGE